MKIRLFLWYWLPVVLYAGMIAMFSSMSTPQSHFPEWVGGINDKIVHALEYAVLAILCYRAFLYGAGPRLEKYAGIFAMAGAILWGVTDEIHQYFVPVAGSGSMGSSSQCGWLYRGGNLLAGSSFTVSSRII